MKCAPGTIFQTSPSQWESSHGQLNNLPPCKMISLLILAYFANLYSSSMFHMHWVDMNPCTCYHFDWIWQSIGLFSCMTHQYSWFRLQMTPPYRSARPICTVTCGGLSTLRLNLQLLTNFSSMVFEQIDRHVYQYEVTHRDVVLNAHLLT